MRRHWTRIRIGAVALVAVASGACSVLFAQTKEQCSTDADCAGRGPGFERTTCSTDGFCVSPPIVIPDAPLFDPDAGDAADDPLGCASLPAPSPDPARQLNMTLKLIDFTTGGPATDTRVRLCSTPDSTCDNARKLLDGGGPYDAGPEGGTNWMNIGTDGVVATQVEYGFDGFFEIRAPQYPPTYRSTSPPLRNEINDFEQILLRPGEIRFLADELTGKPNFYKSATHGLVFVFARDCFQNAIPGASFETSATDPDLQIFYIVNSLPSKTDTKSDALGRGGFINVPPGFHTFTAYYGEGDQRKRLGSGRVQVRAGASTTVAIAPSP